MDIYQLIEYTSVFFNLTYLILLIRENIWCWPCGIIASILSIFLFVETKLYSEAILYSYYILIGMYGWYVWKNKGNPTDLNIKKWKLKPHLIAIVLGVLLAVLLGLGFSKYTEASKPYVDAQTTIFSFIASYMEAHKVLSGWIFWMVINAVSVWLYASKGLHIYSGLMLVYLVLSFVGYWQWRRKYRLVLGERSFG